MANGEPDIIIEGTRDDWPGGRRTLTPLHPHAEPGRDAFWFGARLDPGGHEVSFRVTWETLRRLPADTPDGRGTLLVDRLIVWLAENPGYQLQTRNPFRVCVSGADDTTVERWEAGEPE